MCTHIDREKEREREREREGEKERERERALRACVYHDKGGSAIVREVRLRELKPEAGKEYQDREEEET